MWVVVVVEEEEEEEVEAADDGKEEELEETTGDDGTPVAATEMVERVITIRRDRSGYGMVISADCTISAFPQPDGPAQQAGAVVGSRVTCIRRVGSFLGPWDVNSKQDIVSILSKLEGADAEFVIALPALPHESTDEDADSRPSSASGTPTARVHTDEGSTDRSFIATQSQQLQDAEAAAFAEAEAEAEAFALAEAEEEARLVAEADAATQLQAEGIPEQVPPPSTGVRGEAITLSRRYTLDAHENRHGTSSDSDGSDSEESDDDTSSEESDGDGSDEEESEEEELEPQASSGAAFLRRARGDRTPKKTAEQAPSVRLRQP